MSGHNFSWLPRVFIICFGLTQGSEPYVVRVATTPSVLLRSLPKLRSRTNQITLAKLSVRQAVTTAFEVAKSDQLAVPGYDLREAYCWGGLV